MLEKLKLLYPSLQEETLSILLEAAKSFAADYCGLAAYSPKLDSAVLRMVQEDVTALYAEGLSSESLEGSSVSYAGDYTDRVYKLLNRNKHVRCVESA